MYLQSSLRFMHLVYMRVYCLLFENNGYLRLLKGNRNLDKEHQQNGQFCVGSELHSLFYCTDSKSP